MVIVFALTASIFFAVAVGFGAMYYKQNPEAQLRKRLHDMIDQAEKERAKHPKQKKNIRTTVVDMPTIEEETKPSRLKEFFYRAVRPFFESLDERLQKFAPTRHLEYQTIDNYLVPVDSGGHRFCNYNDSNVGLTPVAADFNGFTRRVYRRGGSVRSIELCDSQSAKSHSQATAGIFGYSLCQRASGLVF